VAVSYAIYSSVGMGVFGFFGGYTKEEGLDTGTRYFFLDFLHQFGPLRNIGMHVFLVFCAVVLGAITWWAWKQATVEVPAFAGAALVVTPVFIRVAMCFAFAMMLLFSPHYPWYIAWLIPFLVLVPNIPLMAYVMAFFYLFTTALADGSAANMLVVNKWLYGGALAAGLLQWAWTKWSVGRWFVSDGRVCGADRLN